MFQALVSKSSPFLLLVAVVATLQEFRAVSAAVISDPIVRKMHNALEKDLTKVTSLEKLQELERITHAHHDQQMATWSRSKVAAEEPDWPCPNATAISPCTCIYSASQDHSLDIDCSEATSDTEIRSAFSVLFPFDDITNFNIEIDGTTNTISNFTQNIFQTKWFSSVNVVGTELETIEDNVFGLSHDTLETMSLQKNKLIRFPFEVVLEYNKLRYIHLNGNNIKELPKFASNTIHELNLNHNSELELKDFEETFVGTPELRTVKLSHTAVSEIPPHLFSTLEHIQEIHFSGNGIKELKPQSINPPGPTIKILDLSDNSLADGIELGSITGLAPDGELNMKNNTIVDLNEDIWKPIFDQFGTDQNPANGSIVLDENPLRCGCEINWIIIDDVQWAKISLGSTCSGGEKVSELDKNFFLNLCEQPTMAV